MKVLSCMPYAMIRHQPLPTVVANALHTPTQRKRRPPVHPGPCATTSMEVFTDPVCSVGSGGEGQLEEPVPGSDHWILQGLLCTGRGKHI